MTASKDSLEKRLQQLREEFEAGKKMMNDLDAQQVKLRDTMLRLSGAIQVIEELLANPEMPAGSDKP